MRRTSGIQRPENAWRGRTADAGLSERRLSCRLLSNWESGTAPENAVESVPDRTGQCKILLHAAGQFWPPFCSSICERCFMADLKNTKVAIIALEGFEEVELTEPRKALEKAGAKVDVVSAASGEIQGFKHHDKAGKVKVDRTLDQARPDEYDALVLPGGALNADQARMDSRIRVFISEFDRASKPMAVICHAPWELISAGILKGRKLTSWPTIQDDVRNAGADWSDREVVVDQNLVTSRGPQDLPAFNREMLSLFTRVPAEARR
jgi:protease I